MCEAACDLMAGTDYRNCTLCRVMRGFAFGGIGAALGGGGALLFGADQQDAIFYALFGAIALTAYMHRKPSDSNK